MSKIRGFEIVSKYNDAGLHLPQRATMHAAGYDIEAAETVTLAPGEIVLIPTGLKAYMQPDEVLYMYSRSSNPRKKGLILINSVGVVDADYYDNADNEGELFMSMRNITNHDVVVNKGERVCQGVFMKYLLTDDDASTDKAIRAGGWGSTE